MPLARFSSSRPLTLGIELELQLINPTSYDLAPAASPLLASLEGVALAGEAKLEMTESMIEIATGICTTPGQALQELRQIAQAVSVAADTLGIRISGGGTHPFQQWMQQEIVKDPRGQLLSELYGYLCKQFTVFGQHVHVGCPGPDEALCLLHSLSRFVPHFIAASASSPFVQGIDTRYESARLNAVSVFPLSGHAPVFLTWPEFEQYFERMSSTGIVHSMKDFYWDVRPKPEFGTVEVRVMDTPLTLAKATAIAGYIQTLARWLLVEKPCRLTEEDYLIYSFNRFQASRFGFDGHIVDIRSGDRKSIRQDMLETLDLIENHAMELNTDRECQSLRDDLMGRGNDASWIRSIFERDKSLPEVVRQQCDRWQQGLAP